jgi:hypothetical protein
MKFNLNNLKTFVRYSWPVLIALAMAIALGVALLMPTKADAQVRYVHYGWHASRTMRVYVGPVPYMAPVVVGGVVGGYGVPYYYNRVIDPTWFVIETEQYSFGCNCYLLVKQYQDRWGNRYPYP